MQYGNYLPIKRKIFKKNKNKKVCSKHIKNSENCVCGTSKKAKIKFVKKDKILNVKNLFPKDFFCWPRRNVEFTYFRWCNIKFYESTRKKHKKVYSTNLSSYNVHLHCLLIKSIKKVGFFLFFQFFFYIHEFDDV